MNMMIQLVIGIWGFEESLKKKIALSILMRKLVDVDKEDPEHVVIFVAKMEMVMDGFSFDLIELNSWPN